MDALEKQARIFTRYLVGRDVSSQATQIYRSAMSASKASKADQKILDFMIKHPQSIGFIDAGLVFHDSTSEARRRLYIMLAILEASPEYCDLFLPKKRNLFYLIVVGYAGFRAVIKSILGFFLVKVIA